MTSGRDIADWFEGRLDDGWFRTVEIRIDKDEILLIGTLGDPAGVCAAGDDRLLAASAHIDAFRELTRDHRVAIASEAETLFGRKVSWAARCCELERVFTQANVPVMTRLLMDERAVLDTLIEAGIARSRSEAMAWCVKLVGANQAEWIDNLRAAVAEMAKVRAAGPDV